jgi:hypothetical protein
MTAWTKDEIMIQDDEKMSAKMPIVVSKCILMRRTYL